MPTKTYHIGVEATMEIIGGKWKSIILCHLRHQTMRNSDLKRAIPQITQKMLTQQLRELEAAQIVQRHVYQQVPPRVDYQLTEYGQSLSGILHELCTWGEDNIDRRRADGETIELLNRDDI
ncbi:winged helix-turn-helix transcriptional regulator [Lactiplantibacillus mudanjiangensis]|uniref:MarR family transcriptional regulator [Lactobacillus koreensis] n=1 Tax=Lactiplantibacillus mudanjiangensis TaxID=1296538 RepID=A0A660ECG4_9LACO|nr:helix-turn-helix domain-containing protein [Lactiplantibacillus mudanjiangensis]VDG20224.1 MarR family transcriptional regulator [Lactobacillus koreensis] [Lactiplantibacillus mudanjiangensis]VDG24082.1 MarR family transcriptional regulator [Lactobacillus koreensis] [Lactiplantibacillus mudanjiangensis]VDG30261.1 MarR family transcriptional regulator [Lactobacillus koreensis] [Lactiplantibacillus mudanjiangensis]VDG33818.1 MarR family transcriptional regulator [Lactobacillus koreensis] [Lact